MYIIKTHTQTQTHMHKLNQIITRTKSTLIVIHIPKPSSKQVPSITNLGSFWHGRYRTCSYPLLICARMCYRTTHNGGAPSIDGRMSSVHNTWQHNPGGGPHRACNDLGIFPFYSAPHCFPNTGNNNQSSYQNNCSCSRQSNCERIYSVDMDTQHNSATPKAYQDRWIPPIHLTERTIHMRVSNNRNIMTQTHIRWRPRLLSRMFRDQTEGRFALRAISDVFVASFGTSLAIVHVPHIQYWNKHNNLWRITLACYSQSRSVGRG